MQKNVYRGHGTKYFEVLVSDDNAAWTSAVYAKMRNPNTEYKCGEAPLERFHVDGGVARGRYVKFVAKSGYQTHVALQYFNLVPYDKREGKEEQVACMLSSSPQDHVSIQENLASQPCLSYQKLIHSIQTLVEKTSSPGAATTPGSCQMMSSVRASSSTMGARCWSPSLTLGTPTTWTTMTGLIGFIVQ